MRRYLAALAAVLLTAGSTLADIAPNPLITGGATASTRDKATPVCMDWEEVDLTPSAEKNSVTAVFLLRNTSDKPTSLEVGFPDYNQIKLKDFTVSIDGAKVEAELKKEDVKVGPKSFNKTYHMEWMVWPMTFDPGATKKVTVTYHVPPTASTRSVRNKVINGRPTSIVDESINIQRCQLPQDIRAKILNYSSGYILHTGAGWKNSIGKATIRIHHDIVPHGEQFAIRSGSDWTYDAASKTSTLVLKDLEPTEKSDIAYDYRIAPADEQYTLITAAMQKRQLDTTSCLMHLKNLKNGVAQTTLSKDELAALVENLKELALPPLGPEVKTNDICIRDEDEIKAIADELMTRYKSAGNTEKARAFAAAYIKFIDDLVAGYPARYDQKWANQRTGYWQAIKKKTNDYLAEFAAK